MPRHEAFVDLTPEQAAEARALWDGGWSGVRVASHLGVTEAVIRRHVPLRRRPITTGSNSTAAARSGWRNRQSHGAGR